MSDESPVTWAEYTDHFEQVSRSRPHERLTKVPTDLLEAHPWLRDFLMGAAGPSGSSGPSVPCREQSWEVADDDIADEEMDRAWEELLAERDQYEDLKLVLEANFVVSVRGGRSTMRKKGVGVDCVVATPRGAVAMSFADKYHMGRMRSFSTLLCGEEAANAMATEVCRRCEYLLSDKPSLKLNDEMFRGYTESKQFRAWVQTLQEGSAVSLRAAKIRAMRPRAASGACGSTE